LLVIAIAKENVYGAFVVAQPVQEFTRFI